MPTEVNWRSLRTLARTVFGIGFWLICGSRAVGLPTEYEFKSGEMGSEWTVVCSQGNGVKFEGGWLRIEGSRDNYAHIQSDLGQDLITVTVKMSSLATAYLVWDEKNWCGVGMKSPTPFGRFYSVTTKGGQTIEVDHRGCLGARYDFQLQIGRDCIRFLYKNDGASEWIILRSMERPSGFTGAPALMAFGKGYGQGTNPFGGLTGSQLGVADGGRIIAGVGPVRVEATPSAALRMTAEERRLLSDRTSDPIGSAVLSREGDPTYEALAGLLPAMKSPREIVGIPEHPIDIGVDYQGRLDASPWQPPTCWFEVGDPAVAFSQAGASFKRRLWDGYLPVMTLNRTIDGIDYELTVFGWNEGFNPEKDMFAYCRMRATSGKRSKLPKQFTLIYQDGEQKRLNWEMTRRGETAEACIRFVHPKPGSAKTISSQEFDRLKEEVLTFWRTRLRTAERFEIPDRKVHEAYRAWLVYSALNATTVKGRVEVHDGSGFYTEIFGHSMGLHSLAMDMYGMHDYVERMLDTMLHYQGDDGLYYQACGLQDHGSLLYAIASHYQMTGRSEWLKSVTPKVLKACEWLVRQRQDTPTNGVVKGLIKFRPYNDAHDPAFNYLGNCQAAMGLKAIAEALQTLGMEAEARKYATEATLYRNDILESMAAAAFRHEGSTILPLEPDTRRIVEMSQHRGGDYYGLTVGSLLATGFMPPFDKRTYWMTDLMEARKGLVGGVCEFMEGIDHAYTYGYWMTQMERDQIRKVLLGFWSMFAFGMTRETYSPVEISHVLTGENQYTLPHTYSLTEQLRLLRNMLVWEDGDVLRLAHAVPRSWLEKGKRIVVREAPTRFGVISYTIESRRDGTMQVHLVPADRVKASRISLRIRHPDGKTVASVKGVATDKVEIIQDTIWLSNLETAVDLTIGFK